MKEALTQFQIDELLQDIIGGQVDISKIEDEKANKVKPYNFKIPKKFTKEQLRTIVGVFDIYARHLSSYFTGILRSYAQVEVLSIEETKYYEFSNALSESVLLGVVEMAPFEGTILMESSKELSYIVMDKLLGGHGEPGQTERDYTDIEIAIMDRLFRNLVYYLKDAWSNIADVEPSFKKFEVNNGTSRIMHLDEIVVITVLSVRIKEVTSNITICIPYVWLEPLNEKLFTRYRMAERTRKDTNTEENRQAILAQIYESKIELKAKLGSTRIKLRDVLNMQPGDVIRLDQKADDSIKVEIANKNWFNVKLGHTNRNKAIQIISSVDN